MLPRAVQGAVGKEGNGFALFLFLLRTIARSVGNQRAGISGKEGTHRLYRLAVLRGETRQPVGIGLHRIQTLRNPLHRHIIASNRSAGDRFPAPVVGHQNFRLAIRQTAGGRSQTTHTERSNLVNPLRSICNFTKIQARLGHRNLNRSIQTGISIRQAETIGQGLHLAPFFPLLVGAQRGLGRSRILINSHCYLRNILVLQLQAQGFARINVPVMIHRKRGLLQIGQLVLEESRLGRRLVFVKH